MDLFQRALLTNKLLVFFLNFEFVFELFAENRKIFNRIAINIDDQSAMCYISVNSSRRALRTN